MPRIKKIELSNGLYAEYGHLILSTCLVQTLRSLLWNTVYLGRGRTSAFGVYIGHRICHSMLATSATLLSRPDITMSEGPKDQTSRCPASKQVISCLMALK